MDTGARAQEEGARMRPSAVAEALAWGAGVAIGVAIGGWLAVVSGAGAPGLEAIDPWLDVVVVPGVAGWVTALCYLMLRRVRVACARSRG